MASQPGAGLLPQHAPSVYEFRQRDDMLFAYVSDRANVMPVYEMPSTAREMERARIEDNLATRRPAVGRRVAERP